MRDRPGSLDTHAFSRTQLRPDREKSSIPITVRPGTAPTFLYSPMIMLYFRLFSRMVVHDRFSPS
jgi:hypothetical protein